MMMCLTLFLRSCFFSRTAFFAAAAGLDRGYTGDCSWQLGSSSPKDFGELPRADEIELGLEAEAIVSSHGLKS